MALNSFVFNPSQKQRAPIREQILKFRDNARSRVD